MTKPRSEIIVRLVADESKAAAQRFTEEIRSEAEDVGEYVDVEYTGGTIGINGPGPQAVDRILNNGRNREGKTESYLEIADPELGACPPPKAWRQTP